MTKGQSLFFAILAAGYLLIGFSLAVRGLGQLFSRGRQVLDAAERASFPSRKWNRSWIGPRRESVFEGSAGVAKTAPGSSPANSLRLVEPANEKRSRALLPGTRKPDASAEPLPQRVA